MKLEEAKELYSAGNPGPSSPRFKAWVAAENFLDGYASRDPEVENLKIKIMTLTNNANGTPWTQGEIEAASSRASQTERILELSAEVEVLKKILSAKEKFSCPCGETTYLLEQNPNHFVGCISHNPTEVKDLKSQIESWKRTAGEAGKNWQQSAEASNELLEQLEAERESSRKLVEAGKLAQAALDTLLGDSDIEGDDSPEFVACQSLALALKFYATPGHSPEGKTL